MDSSTNNQPEQDQPVSQDTNAPEQPIHLPIQKPKPSKGKIAAIVAAVIVVLVAIGGAAYYFLVANKTEEPAAQTQQTPQPSETPQVVSANAESVVEGLGAELKSTTVKTTEKEGQGYWEAPDGTVVASIASYTLDGYDNFVTYPTKGYSTAVSTPDNSKTAINADYDAAVAFLESKEFSKKETGPAYDGGKTGLYASKDAVCSVKVSYELRGYNYFGAACADMSEYKLAYEAAQPFYDAYKNTPNAMKSSDEMQLTIGQPKLGTGVDGYKNAEVGISTMAGFAGLFYQEPGKKWQYFMGVQDAPMCTKFNTATLKKAFNGVACYGSDQKLTAVKAS